MESKTDTAQLSRWPALIRVASTKEGMQIIMGFAHEVPLEAFHDLRGVAAAIASKFASARFPPHSIRRKDMALDREWIMQAAQAAHVSGHAESLSTAMEDAIQAYRILESALTGSDHKQPDK